MAAGEFASPGRTGPGAGTGTAGREDERVMPHEGSERATSLLVAPVPEWSGDTEWGRAEDGIAALGAVGGAASAGTVAGAARPTTGRPPSAGSAPAAVDFVDDMPGVADERIEIALPRPSPRSGSMVRRTRRPRGNEPPQ